MREEKCRFLIGCVSALLFVLVLSCTPRPVSELIVGTWAATLTMPGSEEPVYWELIVGADGTVASLARETAGGPLLGDVSMRGTYDLDGTVDDTRTLTRQ